MHVSSEVVEYFMWKFYALIIAEKEQTGFAPHFIKPLKPIVTEERQIAVLTCKVEGHPTPQIRWYKNET